MALAPVLADVSIPRFCSLRFPNVMRTESLDRNRRKARRKFAYHGSLLSQVRLKRPGFPLKRYRPAHGSPDSLSAFPQTPLHHRVAIHLRVLEIFFCKLVFGAELLILLILLRSTDVCLIVSGVRENVVRFLAFLDHGDLPGRKILELLLLGGRFGSDDFKSGGHKHTLSVLRGGLRAGTADQ